MTFTLRHNFNLNTIWSRARRSHFPTFFLPPDRWRPKKAAAAATWPLGELLNASSMAEAMRPRREFGCETLSSWSKKIILFCSRRRRVCSYLGRHLWVAAQMNIVPFAEECKFVRNYKNSVYIHTYTSVTSHSQYTTSLYTSKSRLSFLTVSPFSYHRAHS